MTSYIGAFIKYSHVTYNINVSTKGHGEGGLVLPLKNKVAKPSSSPLPPP